MRESGYNMAFSPALPHTHPLGRSCAITCRAAPSLLRVGHFELYARRAAKGDAHALHELQLLLVHAVRREYPDLLAMVSMHAGVDDVTREGDDATRGDNDRANELIVLFVRSVRDRLIECVCMRPLC